MEANLEVNIGGHWVPINVNHNTGEVYFMDTLAKSSFRWGDDIWGKHPRRPIKKESPKDTQVGGTHYKEMKIQPGEFIRANNLGWYEANVVKYVCRHKTKNGQEDIKKAIHYLELLLEEYNN